MNKAKQELIKANLDKTHWGERIILAESKGFFMSSDRLDAAVWTTCACGKQDPRIPRSRVNIPKDSQLFNLGCTFADAVHDAKFLLAAKRLVRIENRARKILETLK